LLEYDKLDIDYAIGAQADFSALFVFYLMQYKNKFRNSDCNLRTLANIFEESPAKRMRTTLSNASIANLDFSYLRSTLANTPPTRP